MSHARYSLPAMALHWAQAILVVWLLWLGWTMVDLPKGAERSAAYSLHKSLGLLVLVLTVLRLGWRLRHAPPPALVSGWQARVAGGVHHALYLILLLTPLAGYLLSSFTPYPLRFFGLEVVKLGWPDETLNATFKSAHVILAWTGAALIAVHVAAAIKHALLRDGTLQRMLPSGVFKN